MFIRVWMLDNKQLDGEKKRLYVCEWDMLWNVLYKNLSIYFLL